MSQPPPLNRKLNTDAVLHTHQDGNHADDPREVEVHGGAGDEHAVEDEVPQTADRGAGGWHAHVGSSPKVTKLHEQDVNVLLVHVQDVNEHVHVLVTQTK